MAAGNPPNANHVKLDRLSDHDLLVEIATQVRCLPAMKQDIDANTEKIRDNETEIARLNEKQNIAAGILGSLAVLGSAIASGIGLNAGK